MVSQIEEVGADIGEPDCKLIEPFVVNLSDGEINLDPWLIEFTSQNTYMISSDKILTIADPNPSIIEKYQQSIK